MHQYTPVLSKIGYNGSSEERPAGPGYCPGQGVWFCQASGIAPGWMDGCAPVSITFINPILTLLLLGWQKCEKPSDCSTSPMIPPPLNFCWASQKRNRRLFKQLQRLL